MKRSLDVEISKELNGIMKQTDCKNRESVLNALKAVDGKVFNSKSDADEVRKFYVGGIKQYVKIERDEEAIRNLISIETNFWNNHVLSKVMPDPDGSKVCDEVIKRYYPAARKGAAIPLIGFDEKVERRQEVEALIKKLETESRQIEQEIKLYMADSEMAVCDRYKITWNSYETVRIDSKKLKTENPEVYAQFAARSQSRRFTVSAA